MIKLAKTTKNHNRNLKLIESDIKYKWQEAQCDNSLQSTFTPFKLTLEMLEKINDINGKDILVIANSETFLFIKYLKVNGYINYKSLTLLTDVKSLEGKNGIKVVDFNNIDKLKLDMKFDITLGNPPYDGKKELHLQFLNFAIENTNGIVKIIHPSAWILTKTYNKRVKLHERAAASNAIKFNTEFEFVNGNKHFPDANFFYPLTITTVNTISNNKNEYKIKDSINNRVLKFNDFNDINFHYDSKEYLGLRNKIISYIKNNNNLFKVGNTKKAYNVPISKLRGSQCSDNFFKNDFYTLIPKNCKWVDNTTKSDFIYGFDTEEEANNFIKYLKTDFVRFCLSLYKITGNIKSGSIHKSILYLDYTQEWDDDKLYEHFNISKNEQKIIKSIIPNFYG